jgi:pimeloyl-ACP methyl ester carboxylesterase
MGLALFDGCNYTLRREAPEMYREFAQHAQGQVIAGWEMVVPPPGPDGVPYQFIFVGPTPEHRGSAIRLRLVTTAGSEVPDDAAVLLETYDTLLIWGRLDRIVPLPHGEILRTALPHSRLKVLERCGHLPMVEKPETFHRLLYDFLVGTEEELPDVVQV